MVIETSLDEKNFLVTGASRGIGLAVAQSLAREGANIVMVSRDAKVLRTAVEKILAECPGREVFGIPTDCTDAKQIENALSEIEGKWPVLDRVIVNVGGGRSTTELIPAQDQWDGVWRVNFESAVLTVRTFLLLILRSNGVIIFVSSIAGLESTGAPIDYATAKTALTAFAQNLARKVAPNVRVNVVALGIFWCLDVHGRTI